MKTITKILVVIFSPLIVLMLIALTIIVVFLDALFPQFFQGMNHYWEEGR